MIKITPTSPNASFLDNGYQLTECSKKAKPHSIISYESTLKFYLRYYLLLFFIFSNTLISFTNSSLLLILISSSLFLFLLIFSILSLLFKTHEFTSKLSFFFNPLSLLILTSLTFVLIDPNTLQHFLSQPQNSYLSSLQSLILLSAQGYRFSFYSKKFSIFILFLSLLSLVLNLYIRPDTKKAIFEFFVLICFIFLGPIYMRHFSLPRQAKTIPIGPIVSGVEEITNNLDAIIARITDLNGNSELKQNLPEIIQQLKAVNLMLRKTPNIYSAQMNSVLQGVDYQDKIFIEQACFDSNNVSNVISPRCEILSRVDLDTVYGVSELAGVLKLIGKEWNFNTFFISDCTKGIPLQVIGSYTIKKYGLDTAFTIPDPVLQIFLTDLENKYEKQPYHNSTHAADVMCSLAYLFQNSMLFEHITPLELLAALLSALAHDTGHPGKNNRFLVLSKNDIAILYNDISVLEMMHASLFFQLLKNPCSNILAALVGENWTVARKNIIDMILATDMGKHFELLGQFKTKYLGTDLHDFTNAETRTDLFKLIIKAADIGHAAKCIDLHESWCTLVIQEFFEQGDLEKKMGIPVSMYCDRDATDVCKSQTGFIKNIVYPLFSGLNVVLSSYLIDEKCVQQLILNQKFWENQKKFGRGGSLMVVSDESVKRSFVLPKIKNRKGSLPEMAFG